MWSDLAHRLRSALRRKAVERELDDELRFHLERQTEKHMKAGLSTEDAARRAQIEFGGLDLVKEEYRDSLGVRLLDTIGQDIRYAARTMRRSPGFTIVAVLSLALGIGANTAIFSLLDALMLRSLPVRNPQELVLLQTQALDASAPNAWSYLTVRALAEQNEIFEHVAGFSTFPFEAGRPGSTSRITGAVVTGDYYETLGLNPAAGRLLGREDDQTGASLVAVISHGYWERQFARSPAAVGEVISLNGVPVTIIGVSPPGFVGVNVGSVADITIPVAALPAVSPESAPLLGAGNFWLRALARPKAGLAIPEARARLQAVWPGIAEQVVASHWPVWQKRELTEIVFHFSPGGTGYTYLRTIYREPLLVLMAVVALVLLIACANVGSLLLARASARQREVGVRLAIGAGRGRIMRQLLTESLLLSLIGAACGIGLAWLSGRFVVNMISTGPFQVVFDLTPNWHIIGFTGAVAIAAAVLFGLAPALQASGVGHSSALKADARMSRSRSRLLPSLISIQIALSLLLLIGAGLFVQTLQNLENLDPGFKSEGVLLVDLEGRRTAVPQELLDEVRSVPGVVLASMATHTPLSGAIWSEAAVPQGQPIPERDNSFFVAAGPHFFETMQIPLLSGREFTDRDSAGGRAVAIVNEAFAARQFPNQSPVGQYLSARVRGESRNLEIVGLVKNTNARGLRFTPPAIVYVSYAQLTGDFPTTLEIRASGSIGEVASAIRNVLEMRLGNAALEVRPLSTQVEATMVQERMMATLAGGFGLLALILACVGIYGLLAYSVARRTKELGIRMALGAQRKRVIMMVLGSAVRLVLIGITLGLPAAWTASRWVESLLFRIEPADAATTAGAILVLITTALIAAYLPARRASRVNPIAALRHD